jgi:hypothetical protein
VARTAEELSPADFRHAAYGAVFAGLVEAEGRARALQERLAEIAREMNVADPDQQLLLYREKKQLTDQLRGDSGYLRKGGLKPAMVAERPAF